MFYHIYDKIINLIKIKVEKSMVGISYYPIYSYYKKLPANGEPDSRERVDLRHSELHKADLLKLAETFYLFKEAIEFNLSSNQFGAIENGQDFVELLKALPNTVVILILTGNMLYALEDNDFINIFTIINQLSLDSLDLDRNDLSSKKIEVLEQALAELNNLKKLNLGGNNLFRLLPKNEVTAMSAIKASVKRLREINRPKFSQKKFSFYQSSKSTYPTNVYDKILDSLGRPELGPSQLYHLIDSLGMVASIETDLQKRFNLPSNYLQGLAGLAEKNWTFFTIKTNIQKSLKYLKKNNVDQSSSHILPAAKIMETRSKKHIAQKTYSDEFIAVLGEIDELLSNPTESTPSDLLELLMGKQDEYKEVRAVIEIELKKFFELDQEPLSKLMNLDKNDVLNVFFRIRSYVMNLKKHLDEKVDIGQEINLEQNADSDDFVEALKRIYNFMDGSFEPSELYKLLFNDKETPKAVLAALKDYLKQHYNPLTLLKLLGRTPDEIVSAIRNFLKSYGIDQKTNPKQKTYSKEFLEALGEAHKLFEDLSNPDSHAILKLKDSDKFKEVRVAIEDNLKDFSFSEISIENLESAFNIFFKLRSFVKQLKKDIEQGKESKQEEIVQEIDIEKKPSSEEIDAALDRICDHLERSDIGQQELFELLTSDNSYRQVLDSIQGDLEQDLNLAPNKRLKLINRNGDEDDGNGDKEVNALARVTAALPSSLNSLNLSRNKLGLTKCDYGLADALNAIKSNKLESLNLSCNGLYNLSIEGIQSVSTAIKSSVIKLNLKGNNFGKAKMASSLGVFISNIRANLTHLNLGDNDLDELKSELQDLFTAIGKIDSLTHLNLMRNNFKNIPPKVFEHIPRPVTHLNLSDNDLGNNSSWPDICCFMTSKSITHLDISRNKLNLSGSEKTDEHNKPKLAEATLLSDSFKNLPASLKYLNLSRNGLGSVTQQRLAFAFTKLKDSSITHLNLSFNNFGNSRIALTALATIIPPSVIYLDYSNNGLGSGGHLETFKKDFLDIISDTVTTLNLSNNSLYLLGNVEAVGQVLLATRKIIILDSNKKDDFDFKLAQYLKENSYDNPLCPLQMRM